MTLQNTFQGLAPHRRQSLIFEFWKKRKTYSRTMMFDRNAALSRRPREHRCTRRSQQCSALLTKFIYRSSTRCWVESAGSRRGRCFIWRRRGDAPRRHISAEWWRWQIYHRPRTRRSYRSRPASLTGQLSNRLHGTNNSPTHVRQYASYLR